MERLWRDRARCRRVDPEMFFPVAEPGSRRVREEARAKAVCAQCPVLAQCREWAVERQPYGVAGGLTEGERVMVRLGLRPDAGPDALRTAAVRLVGEGHTVSAVAEMVGRSSKSVRDWCRDERIRTARRGRISSESARGERRARGLGMFAAGASAAEVAVLTGVSKRTAKRWRVATAPVGAEALGVSA